MSSMFPLPAELAHAPPLPPAIVVHGLADAVAALAPGLPVTLLSAPAAGIYAGAGWWRALVEAARATHPATPCADVLDCADAPGMAMAAIRAGQVLLVLDPACPAYRRIAMLATLLPARPPALDLGDRAASRHLHAWLSHHDADSCPEDDSKPALR
jgi:hypothetical protein